MELVSRIGTPRERDPALSERKQEQQHDDGDQPGRQNVGLTNLMGAMVVECYLQGGTSPDKPQARS